MTQPVFIASIRLFSSRLDVLLYFVFFTYKKKIDMLITWNSFKIQVKFTSYHQYSRDCNS